MSTYIIAEIGINHNGDIDLAKELILKAKHGGCDAVKFQKRDIESVYSEEELNTPRESPFGTTTREQKEGIEFDINQYKDVTSLVLDDARDLKKQLGQGDKQKLEEYFESIRAIELQLARLENMKLDLHPS